MSDHLHRQQQGQVVYFMQRSDGQIKIGTSRDAALRRSQVSELHGRIKILGAELGGYDRETELHEQFAASRVNNSEWFQPTDDLLDYIRRLDPIMAF